MNPAADIPRIAFTLNAQQVGVAAEPGERLSYALRERLGARDVKVGCDAGDCGACTVLMDGRPVCACLTPVHQAHGRRVETASALVALDPHAAALADRFMRHGAAQCGICTPAMMVCATALLRQDGMPNEVAVQTALAGVLCRCTGYRAIIDAVLDRPVREAGGGRAAEGGGCVGDCVPRVDGTAKITGREAFGDDIAEAGALEVHVIRAPFARTAFRFDDLAAWAQATPGVVAVLTAGDVPGRNLFGVLPGFEDQPVFAEREARFRGEAVAAVVVQPGTAVDRERFPVIWTELEALRDPMAAQAPGATQMHAGRPGNVLAQGRVRRGGAGPAHIAADVTVNGRFRSGFVEHAYIEPEAGFARIVGETVEIHACTQAPYMDRDAVAGILGWAAERVRIVPTAVGGGFGAKLDLSVQPFLALAALKTGQPVRMAYSRAESMQSSTKRHPSDIDMRVSADKTGRLRAISFHGVFDTGAYASWGPTVANRVPVHASGPYVVPHYHAEATGVFTNNPPAGAFRGFGVPQSAIALESLLDELAERLGLDPLELRLRNALTAGAATVCGQVFESGVGVQDCLEALHPVWHDARADAARFNAENSVLKRGVGVAAGWYGCGNTSLPNPSTIKAGLRADGALVLHQGAVDIGQGSNTVIAQIFAQAFGARPSDVTLVGADTAITPDAGKTSASRQTFVTGNAARMAGEALRRQVLARLNASPDAAICLGPGAVSARDAAGVHRLSLGHLPQMEGGFVLMAQETYDPPTEPLDADGQGAPYAQYGYAAQIAVVDVDTELGTVHPVRVVAAHDVGRTINPVLVRGQVQGGVAQGIGMALMEEYLPGRTENLHDYLVPTIGDVPPIDVLIVEDPDPHGPYGAKGLGEHALIPTAPAILNAIRHATGARITQVPASPSRVLAALREQKQ